MKKKKHSQMAHHWLIVIAAFVDPLLVMVRVPQCWVVSFIGQGGITVVVVVIIEVGAGGCSHHCVVLWPVVVVGLRVIVIGVMCDMNIHVIIIIINFMCSDSSRTVLFFFFFFLKVDFYCPLRAVPRLTTYICHQPVPMYIVTPSHRTVRGN